jgi:ActR/RegA family two-component response regulator
VTSGADDAQRAAFDARADAIRAMEDPVSAFEAAGDLVEQQAAFRGLAARVRAEQAQRVFDSGEMSLSELGRRLGMTKQRAAKILQRAREGGR